MQGKSSKSLVAGVAVSFVGLTALAVLAGRYTLTEWRRAAETLAQQRRSTARLCASRLASEFERCATLAASATDLSAGCEAGGPISFFRSGGATSSASDAMRKRLAGLLLECRAGRSGSCERLADEVERLDAPSSLVAYYGAEILERLPAASRDSLRHRLGTIVFADTVARHRSALDRNSWTRVGRLLLRPIRGDRLIGADASPSAARLRSFFVSQGVRDVAQLDLSIAASRPASDETMAAAYVSAELGYLVLTDPAHQESLLDRRRETILLAVALAAAFLLAALALAVVYRAALQLARIDRLRANFVAAVSHEYRTPLGALRLMLDTLRQRTLDATKQREYLGRMDSELQRLTYLTGNMLALNRMQRGFAVQPESCRAAAIVGPALEALAQEAQDNGIELDANVEDVELTVDPNLFGLVLTNLVANAIKYGPRDSKVSITVGAAEDGIRVRVSDEGPGIPAADQKRIFAWFERLEDERTRTKKGTGIGLALAKAVIDAHRGTLTVANRQPCGAVFLITLPSGGQNV